MAYEYVTLNEEISIDKIVTIHYYEYMSDYYYSGESHNFWEFLCVDKGEVDVMADSSKYSLKTGEIIFHKPNEFHNLKANGRIAPNLVVISFICDSPAMDFFNHKILSISESERNLLAQIIIEAKNSFSSALDDPYLSKLERCTTSAFASEQLIKLYLQQFLIHMVRRNTTKILQAPPTKSTKKKNDEDFYGRILHYLEEHLYTHVSIDQICKDNLIGRSQLQKLFRDRHDCGIIDYYSKMKIDAAKQLIRENHYNFTQISDMLGYTSVHYFSRQFKKITGMTPSEYAYSIKLLSEKH